MNNKKQGHIVSVRKFTELSKPEVIIFKYFNNHSYVSQKIFHLKFDRG